MQAELHAVRVAGSRVRHDHDDHAHQVLEWEREGQEGHTDPFEWANFVPVTHVKVQQVEVAEDFTSAADDNPDVDPLVLSRQKDTISARKAR